MKIIRQPEISIYEYSQLKEESVIIVTEGNINDHALCDSDYLTNVYIYGNNTTLGLGAFCYCKNIKSIQMYGVSVVGEGAFTWCEQLERISLMVNVLEKGAFFQCKSLKEIVFFSDIIRIKRRTFYGCDNIETVVFLGKPPRFDTAFEWDNNLLRIYIKHKYESVISKWNMGKHIEKHIIYFD